MGSSSFIDAADPKLGKVIADEFTLEEKIGAGGIGTVYRALQAETDRVVAIKLLHESITSRTLYKRFKREAQIACSLSHPNIVSTLKYGQSSDGTAYLAMEYVQGVDLGEILHPGIALDGQRSLQLMHQMAEAIAYAHDQDVVHRDIKPSNLLLTRSGQIETVKLADFGMAKVPDENPSLTKTGSLVGSPYYISPEQWEDPREVDGRGDIYSLGCVFYLMVTGTLPFLANDLPGLRRAHLYSSPPSPDVYSDSLTLMPELSDLILACIRRDRDERFQSSHDLVKGLREVQSAFDEKLKDPSTWKNVDIPLPSHMRRIEIPTILTPVPGLLETPSGVSVPTPVDQMTPEMAAQQLQFGPHHIGAHVGQGAPKEPRDDAPSVIPDGPSDSLIPGESMKGLPLAVIIIGFVLLLALFTAGAYYWFALNG